MSTLRLKTLAPHWNVPRLAWRWPFAGRLPAELRALQRRLVAARFGVDSPRRPVRQAPYEDLQ